MRSSTSAKEMTLKKARTLVFECSEASLSTFGPGASTLSNIDTLASFAFSEYGLPVQFLVYDGMASPYGGGRPMASSPEEISRTACSLNEHGVSFALALNGGLTLPGDIELTPDEREVLRILDLNNRTLAVRNKVIVTHERMLHYIRARYPSLEVVASCIQVVNPRLHGGYAERLRLYDSVVFMNQHSSAEYLQQYAAYASKIVLFLLIRCGNDDLAQCYAHYAGIELQYGRSASRRLMPRTELPQFEESVLPEDAFGCLQANEFRPRVCLLQREHDLSQAVEMGVRTFKVPRLASLDWESYVKFLDLASTRV